MESREPFVNVWTEFVKEWCLGTPPSVGERETRAAFDALSAYWPEYLHRIAASPARGLMLVIPAIDLGWVVGRCSSLSGFSAVFLRAKRGEKSALSELAVAATLVDLGLNPEFEPTVGKKRPDLGIRIANSDVFLELIRPDFSADIRRAQSVIDHVADRLFEAHEPFRTEVVIERELSADDVERLISAIGSATLSAEVRRFEDAARFIKEFTTIAAPVDGMRRISGSGSGMTMFSGKVQTGEQGRTSVTVGGPSFVEDRAHRLLSAEHHHFSRDEANMIVVNTTDSGRNASWVSLVRRWFQPNRNRRVGAVLLCEQGMIVNPPSIQRNWSFIKNPHAIKPLPREFVGLLETLEPIENQ